MTGVWCHYRKREVWTQNWHIERTEGIKTHWAGWILSRGGNDLDTRWWVSCELSEPHFSSALNFKCCTKAGIVVKHFPGQPSNQVVQNFQQVFSAFWQQYPNHSNKHVLTKDVLHQERTPDQNLPLEETSNQYAHWMDWLFPTNPDHSLIVCSREHHYFVPSESDCSHLHLEHQPGPADGGGESRYTVITTVCALTEC